MDYNTFEEDREQREEVIEIDVFSVYRALEHVTDGRRKRGVRYSLVQIMTLIRLGEIGRNDNASSHCRMGTSSRKLAQANVRVDSSELSLRLHL